MKIKTADLIGLALDWAVAVVEGLRPVMHHDHMRAKAAANNYKGDLAWHLEVTPNEPITVDEIGVTHVLRPYSEQWSQGGPIIEREELGLKRNAPCSQGREWEASPSITAKGAGGKWGYGPTPLIAAMRCYVASKLGDEIDVPEELL